uniref:RAB3GAP2_N domain-containing protein n=1 Tax=Angiostrongylus cantonensis TaxID=6313 RepID=A0A0K0DA95_ANGCA
MALSFSLEGNVFLSEELAEKLQKYLLDGGHNESLFNNLGYNFLEGFVKRSLSSSSDEIDVHDSEEPAGVLGWEFSAPEQRTTMENVDASPLWWISHCYMVTYNSMDYVLLVNQQRLVLLARSTADEMQLEIRFLKELDSQLQFAEQIAKGEKSADQLSNTLELDVDRLKPEKGNHGLRYVLFTGIHRQSAFEQYSTASMTSFNETISSTTPPQYFTYMYTSDRVFSTFAWTTESDKKRIWSEAVKYGKSFVPHLGIRDMLGISSTRRKKTVISQNAHVITTRGTLGDSRLAVTVATEVIRGLIAVVDHIARVVLIDVPNRQIIRIWKGYRDAAVAWVTSTNGNQTALFLSIFAPRRALLEVWNVQSGVRVGALHVDAAGVLLDGGLAPVLCGSQNARYERNAFFVDSQGRFSQLVVPFHLSMLCRTSQDQHDQLLLSKLSFPPNMKSFMDIYSSLRMQKSKRELILSVLPYISEYSSLQKLLNDIPKTEDGGPVEELLSSIQRQMSVYNKLIEYSNLEETVMDVWESHFNQDVKEVLKTHCFMGEENYSDAELLRFGEFVFAPVLSRKIGIQEFEETVLANLPFDKEGFSDLLCFVFTKSKSRMGEVGFGGLCEFLAHAEQRSPDTLEKCEKMALESYDISRALLLFAACSIIRRKLSKSKKPVTKEDSEEDILMSGDDWEAVDPSAENADCIILVMHAAFLAGRLKQTISFAKLVNCARGFFREQVAEFVAREKWDANQLEERMSRLDIIEQLRSLLPNTLSPKLIRCDIAWELMSQWYKDTSKNFDNFELAMRYVEVVDDARLRHGVLVLIWQNFVLERFKATILLIEKTGRAPKERESRQQLQIPEVRVVDFLSRCYEMLKMLLDDVRDAPPPSYIQRDHLIEVTLANVSNPTALNLDAFVYIHGLLTGFTRRVSYSSISSKLSSCSAPLSLSDRCGCPGNKPVRFLRIYLTCVKIKLSAGLRNHILRVLFCPIGQRAFFIPLDSHPLIPLDRVDDTIMERRHQFIAKVNQLMFHKSIELSIAEQGTDVDRKLVRILSCEWNLTVDTIQATQVLCLLRAGQDSAASREMAGVVHTDEFIQTMTRFLITVAGDEKMRVNWPSNNWKDAVQSFGQIVSCLSLEPKFLAQFIRIGSITVQYWGIHVID